ncbi:MAG TPA: hypothetical protein VEZ90_04345, partial [Blastocatellia bacterium]|nr:hypothetical protein [Blastocatellia bacterium]
RLQVTSEEYGLFEGRPITRGEYDDGAAEIDGRIVDTIGRAEHRIRYLTPYNFLIAAHDSQINNHDFDLRSEELLNLMLFGKAKLTDLVAEVDRLPKH